MSEKKELTDLTKEELETELINIGEKKFRAKQLWQWIYFRGEKDFNNMSNLPLTLRQKLDEHYTITRPKIITEQISVDKTDYNKRLFAVTLPHQLRSYFCLICLDKYLGINVRYR